MTMKEIAEKLGLSLRTVQSYIENGKCKLDCPSRTEILKIYTNALGFEWLREILKYN